MLALETQGFKKLRFIYPPAFSVRQVFIFDQVLFLQSLALIFFRLIFSSCDYFPVIRFLDYIFTLLRVCCNLLRVCCNLLWVYCDLLGLQIYLLFDLVRRVNYHVLFRVNLKILIFLNLHLVITYSLLLLSCIFCGCILFGRCILFSDINFDYLIVICLLQRLLHYLLNKVLSVNLVIGVRSYAVILFFTFNCA